MNGLLKMHGSARAMKPRIRFATGTAVETAAGSLRDLRVAEVTKMDMRVENGKVLAFRTRVALSFKYET
jgi:dodecin